MKKFMIIVVCSLIMFTGVWYLSNYFKFDWFLTNIIISVISVLFILPVNDRVWAAPSSWGAMNADSSVAKKTAERITSNFRISVLVFFLPFYICTLYYIFFIV